MEFPSLWPSARHRCALILPEMRWRRAAGTLRASAMFVLSTFTPILAADNTDPEPGPMIWACRVGYRASATAHRLPRPVASIG